MSRIIKQKKTKKRKQKKKETYVGLVSATSPLVSPRNTFQNLIVANALLFLISKMVK